MLKKRIIPILLINNKDLIKTIKFKNNKYIGDPLNAIKIFQCIAIDKIHPKTSNSDYLLTIKDHLNHNAVLSNLSTGLNKYMKNQKLR